MKITFFSEKDTSVGSTRIWIYDLCHYLRNLQGLSGYTQIVSSQEKYNTDVIIFEKSTSPKIVKEIKDRNPKALIGLINPSFRKKFYITNAESYCDFFIVGSVEERDFSLQFSENVFIFPLIEKMYTKHKKHEKKETTVLSYHGNLHHLAQFQHGLKNALERIDKEYPIQLNIIYNTSVGKWKTGRPNIPIEIYDWNADTIENQLLESDIGLVPGIATQSNTAGHILKMLSIPFYNSRQGRSTEDFLLRFKNKTNAGRAFVYHQLKIPVVSGFIPSSFHIIGANQNGFLAHNSQGWYSAIKKLIESVDLRTEMAERAYLEFQKQYDPYTWAESLVKDIRKLVRSRSS